MDLYDDLDKTKASQIDGWSSGIKMLQTQLAAKKASSAASSPHLFFSVPVPHALRAPLALCSPLILHWTVRMDFAVLSQLK